MTARIKNECYSYASYVRHVYPRMHSWAYEKGIRDSGCLLRTRNAKPTGVDRSEANTERKGNDRGCLNSIIDDVSETKANNYPHTKLLR